MDALSATQSILNTIIENPNGKHVVGVHISVGELSGLDPASIQTYWNELSRGTSLEQAQLRFRLIPAELQCMVCFGKYRPIDQQTLCPVCGSVGAKVLAGEECFVESIQTE